jgi:hypothetical protein
MPLRSLTESERLELLERMNKLYPTNQQQQQNNSNNETNDAQSAAVKEDRLENSIAEAVAAAGAHESQRQTGIWETEKKTIFKEATKAAEARIQAELVIQQRRMALEKWQSDGKQEQAENRTDPSITDDVHPILGPVLLDLGYKRIYVVSAHVCFRLFLFGTSNVSIDTIAPRPWRPIKSKLTIWVCPVSLVYTKMRPTGNCPFSMDNIESE